MMLRKATSNEFALVWMRRRKARTLVLLSCVLLWVLPRDAADVTFVNAAKRTARMAMGCSALAKGQGEEDGSRAEDVKMTLEEEFRTGVSLEEEFKRVKEARERGEDIPREPGLEPRSDVEVFLNKAQDVGRQLVEPITKARLDGVMLFWVVVIGLIVLSWLIQL
mmetsp:Transcript_12466/g.28209  ORF Transcript_12466/g.28209 Transcript_12466/m.28209 type:complete len:165 (+) Transcript_12466:57-551(+)